MKNKCPSIYVKPVKSQIESGARKILVVLYVASLSDVYEKTCTLLL